MRKKLLLPLLLLGAAPPALAQSAPAVPPQAPVQAPPSPEGETDWGRFGVQTQWMDTAAKPGDDFDAYAKAQREVDGIWTDKTAWYSKTIRNTARMGWFSSDRTIRQYAKEIWRA